MGAAIRNQREALGWSQTSLAKLLGSTPPYLCDVEAGRTALSAAQCTKFEKTLHLPENSLVAMLGRCKYCDGTGLGP
jgi:ribosome-binding protein aMBF1 (putative translation factor)